MADQTPAPLSDAEIEAIANHYYDEPSAAQWSEIRERLYGKMTFLEYYDDAPHIVVRLLATLATRDARLAALERERAAMREIVAAVAAMHTSDMRRAVSGSPELVTRARALLATQTPATGATAGEEGAPG